MKGGLRNLINWLFGKKQSKTKAVETPIPPRDLKSAAELKAETIRKVEKQVGGFGKPKPKPQHVRAKRVVYVTEKRPSAMKLSCMSKNWSPTAGDPLYFNKKGERRFV